ncbi:MAG: hypothetical protein ACJ74Z_03615 [Bryobacteraceae bacterium]
MKRNVTAGNRNQASDPGHDSRQFVQTASTETISPKKLDPHDRAYNRQHVFGREYAKMVGKER